MNKNEFHTKIAGVTHKNRDGSSRQDLIRQYCRPGQRLLLLRELDNPFSKTAIGIWLELQDQRYQFGYISDEVSQDLARYLDKGSPYTATVQNITGGTSDAPTLGVNLLITPEAAPVPPAAVSVPEIKKEGTPMTDEQFKQLIATIDKYGKKLNTFISVIYLMLLLGILAAACSALGLLR